MNLVSIRIAFAVKIIHIVLDLTDDLQTGRLHPIRHRLIGDIEGNRIHQAGFDIQAHLLHGREPLSHSEKRNSQPPGQASQLALAFLSKDCWLLLPA